MVGQKLVTHKQGESSKLLAVLDKFGQCYVDLVNNTYQYAKRGILRCKGYTSRTFGKALKGE